MVPVRIGDGVNSTTNLALRNNIALKLAKPAESKPVSVSCCTFAARFYPQFLRKRRKFTVWFHRNALKAFVLPAIAPTTRFFTSNTPVGFAIAFVFDKNHFAKSAVCVR